MAIKGTGGVVALVTALRQCEPAPAAEDGWIALKDLMADLGLSEAATRRRIRGLRERIERRLYGGFMYYRLKNGKAP